MLCIKSALLHHLLPFPPFLTLFCFSFIVSSLLPPHFSFLFHFHFFLFCFLFFLFFHKVLPSLGPSFKFRGLCNGDCPPWETHSSDPCVRVMGRLELLSLLKTCLVYLYANF